MGRYASSRSARDRALRMPPAEALVGRLLCGKWRIEGVLSLGGTSSVYSASHRNGMRVAIKVLRSELSVDPRTRRRFLREGYLANRVGHPGAVSVLDDDTADGGMVFLVMELLEGTNLEKLSRDVNRDPNEVAFFADGLLDILAAAHRTGIVHRDIKPSNVFLTTKGEIRLLDFGIARLREPSSARSHTRDGAVLGTPGFMAPEQARGRLSEVGARTDIWAVGATMFRLLTGRLVHEAATGQESMIAAATLPAPLLKSACVDVHDSVGELVDRALRFEAGERWQDAKHMQNALRAARSELPPYVWRGISLTDDVTDERTIDPSDETPTTSSFEDSQGPALRFEVEVERLEAGGGSRRRLFLGPIVATVAAGVLMLAGLHGQADRAKRRASADAPTLFGAIHEPVSYGGTAGLETTRVDATGGVATLATTDGAIAEVRPAAHDRSPEPTPPRRSNPKETHARTSAQPAPTRRYAGPPALEEFLNERR